MEGQLCSQKTERYFLNKHGKGVFLHSKNLKDARDIAVCLVTTSKGIIG